MRRLLVVLVLLCAVSLLAQRPRVDRPRRLSDRGLVNLTAFARLYGYLSCFHPSDEAARTDWIGMAVNGVRVVEDAKDPSDLARKLEEFFRPAAPLLRVFPSSDAAPAIDSGYASKVVFWRHHGFGGGAVIDIFHSGRLTTEAPGGRLPPPFAADLGGGIRAIVPLALFADEKGTLPHTSYVPAAPSAYRYTVDDRATRLAGVIIAWNVLEHFHPYFDVVQTDWPKALEIAMRSAAEDDSVTFRNTTRRLVAALKDGQALAGPPAVPSSAPAAWDWIEDRLIITSVHAEHRGKIAPGDAVITVSGYNGGWKALQERTVTKALAGLEELISGATPQWIRHSAMLELGYPYTPRVVLGIERFSDGSRRTLTFDSGLTRGTRPLVSDPKPEKIAELEPGIFYVDLTRIGDLDWKAALDLLTRASGIIFDLRGRWPNPRFLGHLTAAPLNSPQFLVPVITEPHRKNLRFKHAGEWVVEPAQPYLKAKRAVLTDASVIGYAESLAAIVEHYKLAEIVGQPTAGTIGERNVIRWSGTFTIQFTGVKALKQDGSRIHGIGVRPTIPVARTRAGVAAGRDEVLERAIRAVR